MWIHNYFFSNIEKTTVFRPIYDFEILETWFPKDEFVWVDKDFAKASSASKGKKQNKGTELLIMNYVIPGFTELVKKTLEGEDLGDTAQLTLNL